MWQRRPRRRAMQRDNRRQREVNSRGWAIAVQKRHREESRCPKETQGQRTPTTTATAAPVARFPSTRGARPGAYKYGEKEDGKQVARHGHNRQWRYDSLLHEGNKARQCTSYKQSDTGGRVADPGRLNCRRLGKTGRHRSGGRPQVGTGERWTARRPLSGCPHLHPKESAVDAPQRDLEFMVPSARSPMVSAHRRSIGSSDPTSSTDARWAGGPFRIWQSRLLCPSWTPDPPPGPLLSRTLGCAPQLSVPIILQGSHPYIHQQQH